MVLNDYITTINIKGDKKIEKPEKVNDGVINKKKEEINPNEKKLNNETISVIYKMSSEKKQLEERSTEEKSSEEKPEEEFKKGKKSIGKKKREIRKLV